MPFQSTSQMRACFAAKDPKWDCHEWAAHTPNMKKLPEKKKPVDKVEEKKAFAASFILKCAAAGITSPEAVAKVAETFVANLEKQALLNGVGGSVAGGAVGLASLLPVLGTVVAPALLGYSGGMLAGSAKNQMDHDDAESLRIRAEANAYRRRAALAKTHAEVRKLVESNPSKYTVIG